MFPVALVCGNTYVVKPSERDPGACMMLVEMLREAGAPDGVVNVIHGQHDAVNFICDHPDIKAISFVGSDQAVSHTSGSCRFCFGNVQFLARENISMNEDRKTENAFKPIWELKITESSCLMPTRKTH